mmetsp:Transcript_7967/g.20473  ORF Transcript_7967/g.20473 Transcript_7967/m.20473 type:complete len:82 (+) Transcript_7967:216-461(+)
MPTRSAPLKSARKLTVDGWAEEVASLSESHRAHTPWPAAQAPGGVRHPRTGSAWGERAETESSRLTPQRDGSWLAVVSGVA